MRITGFKMQKGRKQAITVEFEDGKELQVDPELIVRFHLGVGMDLDEQFEQRLREENSRLLARRRLVAYLSARRKTTQEARLYLERLGFPATAVEYALEAVRELGLLDDAEFAQAYTRTQKKVAKKGPRAIEFELLSRGVSRGEAEEVVSRCYSPQEQVHLAREIAEKRMSRLSSSTVAEKHRKLSQYLFRRGFDPEIVAEVVRELLHHEEND
jgi:regulatory protein